MSCEYIERVLRVRVLACKPCITGAGWPHVAAPAETNKGLQLETCTCSTHTRWHQRAMVAVMRQQCAQAAGSSSRGGGMRSSVQQQCAAAAMGDPH